MKCISLLQNICYLTNKTVISADIENLSSFYKFDCTVLVREFTLFRALYRKMHSLVNVTDLLHGLNVHLLTTDYDTDDVSESDEVKTNTWADMSFIKPLRAITKLSGFPTLTLLYNILVSLAVTSSTVEKAMC